MDRIRKILAVLKARPARKLTIVSVILTLVIAVILFLGSFLVIAVNEVNLLEGNISALPELLKERGVEYKRQSDVYKNDYIACGELATLIYNNYESVETNERLEFIRKSIEATDVTLLDGSGKLIASTSKNAPSAAVTNAFSAISSNPEPLYDPNLAGINQKMEDEDGYVPEADSMPMVYNGRTGDGNILMVEFDYTSFGNLLLEQSSYEGICERALAGMEGYAFMRSEDGSVSGYPANELSESEKDQLGPEIKEAFDKEGIALGMEEEGDLPTTYSLASLLGKMHLLVKLPASVLGSEFMIAVPVVSFSKSMLMCDLAILVLVVVGYILFSRYATRSFRKFPVNADDKRLHARRARRQTRTGALVMVFATGILTCMLLMLVGMTSTASITMTQQKTIGYETEYRTERKSNINKEYSKRYTTRATALARLLSDYPELRTREALQRFSKAIQVDYLMLFDKNGNELFSSNSYTGFSLGNDKSGALQEWRPVLQGYEQVETPTQKNPVTGKYERTVATLVTDGNGLPDGMLVMSVNDDAYMSEIGDASLEGVVKSFTPRKGQVVGVVNNETGQFVAHTDAEMNGEVAENYLDKNILGRDFEGYTAYKGKDVYVSGVSTDGKTTLVITDSSSFAGTQRFSFRMVVVILLLMLLIFYPAAASLCSKYAHIRSDEKKSQIKGHPMMIFYHGYVAYIAALALVAFLGSIFDFWNAFGYVFSFRWTHGIHLFSIWAALFVFAISSYITTGLHRVIRSIDEKVNTHTKTFARLVDSLVTYAIAIITTVLILTVLGVDTATIIGSVSIVSIAIGMGTQDLVKDIVAGLFLVFEGTISVGDIVEIGNWRGRVTDMGIRTTEITNEHNDVKILTNSKIGDVVNLSKVKTLCTEEFELPRTVEVSELPALVDSYIEEVVKDVPEIKDSLELDEVTSINENSYTVRLTYMINEAERESATIRLRNAMNLLLEGVEQKSTDKS